MRTRGADSGPRRRAGVPLRLPPGARLRADPGAEPPAGPTTVYDAGRTVRVGVWLGTPAAVHLGDEVGPPRGGLAPDGTYHVHLPGSGHLIVVSGVLRAWPGPDWPPEQWPGGRDGLGPCLAADGERAPTRPVAASPAPPAPLTDSTDAAGSTDTAGAANQLAFRAHHPVPEEPVRFPAPVFPAPATPPSSVTAGDPVETDQAGCPRCVTARPHLAGPEDERQEQLRRDTDRAVAAAASLVCAALDPTTDPVPAEVTGARLAQALDGFLGIRAVARYLTNQLGPDLLGGLITTAARAHGEIGPPAGAAGPGDTPGAVPSREASPVRVLVEEAIARYGVAILPAVPARLLAEGVAARALLVPELERLVGYPLPSPLDRLAVRALHGLDIPFAEVAPADVAEPLSAVTGLRLS
jgi:hypothetical protein